LIKTLKRKNLKNISILFTKSISFKSWWHDFNSPLINKEFNLFLFSFIATLVFVYFRMGTHGGQWLTYFFHLISPFLIFVIFWYIHKLKISIFITIPLLCLNLYTLTFLFLPMKYVNSLNGYKKPWEILYKLVEKKQKIFNSPILVPLLMKKNKEIFDSGHSEFFIDSADRNPLFDFVYPHPEQIIKKDNAFMLNIYNSVKNNAFDLIILTTHKDLIPAPLDERIIRKHYAYKGTINISMIHGFQSWELHVWEPNIIKKFLQDER